MSLHQFYCNVWKIHKNSGWRIGQALFNHLRLIRPDLAEYLRGTNFDPFHASSITSVRYVGAIQFIENNWSITSSTGEAYSVEQLLGDESVLQ